MSTSKNLPRNDSIEHSSKEVQVDSEEDVGNQEIWDSSENDLYVAFESSEVEAEEEESECAEESYRLDLNDNNSNRIVMRFKKT